MTASLHDNILNDESSMNDETVRTITECAHSSAAGRIHFGEIVERLSAAGVERYHADYSRMVTTYYTPAGESHVVPMQHEAMTIAEDFSAVGIATAVKQSQRGEIMYPQFTRHAAAAGCVGYFVLLTGGRVQYFGRNGDFHTEWFPGRRGE